MANWLNIWLYASRGTTAIEYALIAGGISLAIVAAVMVTGDNLEYFLTIVAEPLPDISERVETARP